MSETIYSKLNLCPAKAGTLCGCGRCKKIIFTLAAKAGIHPAAFSDSLGLTVARKSAKSQTPRFLGQSRVAENLTVSTRGGEQSTGAKAIIKTLTFFNENGG